MKSIAIGVHLHREDINDLADAVPAASLFLSAVSVADEQPLTDRDLLLRVASTRAALLERATFIAVRYGFTFRGEAEAATKIAANVDAWRSLLEENRTRVEFTLKVAAAGSARPDRRDFSSGAEYMRALHDARDSVSIPPSFRDEVERLIVPTAVRHQWMKRDTTSVELAGLIERESLPRLSAAGETLKAAAPGVPFLLSAPWPLEVFAQ